MVKLSLPLLDNLDNESENSSLPNCDPSQSIYDNKSCIKDFRFCSDDNPCPSDIPCIDRVCQCLPNTQSFITLTPPPVRMYTIGCNFDTKRPFEPCRDYEYNVNNQTCLLNYCSNEVPCYAGTCDNSRHVCVNTNTTIGISKPLPQSTNPVITLGDDPFGTNKPGISPVLIILMAAGGVMVLALIGCIFRMTTSCTRRSLDWVSGDKTDNEVPYSRGKERNDGGGDDDDITAVESSRSINTLARNNNNNNPYPSKFTGSHYMPSPHLHPSNDSVSAFNSPLPSPRASPYSNPNHSYVSNSSLLSPYRRGAANDSNSSIIELNDRNLSRMKSNESLAPSENRVGTPTFGVDSTMSRSQSTLSRDYAYKPPSGLDPHNQHSLHKSMSMQQLGSRPAPPPPTGSQRPKNLSGPIQLPSPPAIAITHSRPTTPILTQEDMDGPFMSLDSLIEQANGGGSGEPMSSSLENNNRSVSPRLEISRSASSPSARSPLVLQSGAERQPSITVARGSMLRHSASVPQLVVSSPLSTELFSEASPSSPSSRPSSPQPAARNLPSGFVSSPLADSKIPTTPSNAT
ncbi:hypothetical protein BGZ76_006893 [Entomortierella beljakovae]|nr:hypothetical protein BGZ76_006893 [Entomortierella beljakovae]